MRYFMITDSSALLRPILSLASSGDELFLYSPKNGGVPSMPGMKIRAETGDFARGLAKRALTMEDRIVVRISSFKKRAETVRKARGVSPFAPILVLVPSGVEGETALPKRLVDDPNTSVLRIGEALRTGADEQWRIIEIRKRIGVMKNSFDRRKPLWILLQNDPDPDAIGSAMALRVALGLKAGGTPIVTLKQVTRNENINMINLLGVRVREVTEEQLARAPQIAMVDVQPGHFPFLAGNIRIVIDHHPVSQTYSAAFADIRPECGATSIILTEYLKAGGVPIGRRLATALYYAIKTDTLLLGRDVSDEGFRAFSALWPLANHQLVSQMERPRMKSQEVTVFVRALKRLFIERGCLFADLGRVPKEDLVPRIADFVMQIGNPEMAVVWGVLGTNITFAARSLDPSADAGKVMKGVFGHLGSAGGHRVMARATMPLAAFRKEFGGPGKGRLRKRILKVIDMQRKRGS